MAQEAANPWDAIPAGYSSSNLPTFAQGIEQRIDTLYVGVVLSFAHNHA
jgi:hypothetical protein